MARLFPRREVAVERADEPAVLCLEDDRTDELLESLASETARSIFRELNDRPGTATDVADALGMSVQRVHYHLEALCEVSVVEVVDTCYSEKGREMSVYGPSEVPYLLFLGSADDQPGLQTAFSQLASVVGPPAVILGLLEVLSRFVGRN